MNRLLCLALVSLAALSTGCARFWRAPLEVSEAIRAEPKYMLAEGRTPDAAAFAAAFPDVARFRLSSRALAQTNRFFGRLYLNLSMIAAGPKSLRLLGSHPGDSTTLFEMLVAGDEMRVYVPPAKTLYEGSIAGGETPFGAAFGVEPWDLLPAILIGRRLAAAPLETQPGRKRTKLRPAAGAANPDGLLEAEIENSALLPSRASWQRGKTRWRADYLEWELFPSEVQGGAPSPMPARFILRRARPYAKIEVRARPGDSGRMYLLDPELSAQAFELRVPKGAARASLEELGRALGAK